MLRELVQAVIRRRRPVEFQDLSRPKPISGVFGCERGTPVDRYYIEKFLSSHAGLIKGRVLEVGEPLYAGRFGVVDAVDLIHPEGGKGVTIKGDLADAASIPANTYDCFICTQTLNFIFDVQSAIRGAYQLLKTEGVLLATVAGICQVSRYDADRWGDFWRFTDRSLTSLVLPVFGPDITVSTFGNVMAACALLQGVAVEDLPDAEILDYHDQDYQVVVTLVARKSG